MAEIARARIGHATYLTPSEPLVGTEVCSRLRESIDRCIDDGEPTLVLDLAASPIVDSIALELMLDVSDALEGRGGQLKFTNASGTVREVLELTGVAGRVECLDPDDEPPARPGRGGRQRIGEILIERSLITEAQLEEALAATKSTGRRMSQVLVDKGWIREAELMEALSEQLGLPVISLRPGAYDPLVVRSMPKDVCRLQKLLPLFRVRDTLLVATPEPQSVPALDAVEDLTGLRPKPVLATTAGILDALAEAHSGAANLAEFVGDLETDLELIDDPSLETDLGDELAAASPVISLINGVIQRAVHDRASDIHIERSRAQCRVRLRVDGILYTIMTPPPEVHPALVSRLKVMANLDIAERRLPQDGRLQVVTHGRHVDLRFSSLPGIYGEKVVLRVLDKTQAILDVDKLGLEDHNRDRFRALLARSFGLMLVTGPTGSGKTTSLYAALVHLNSSERNIVTIEDPVEYQIEGLNQNPVRESIDLSFARILKHTLRQDPDIIMVGEIRERETATIAVQAALTGHLVLSTLHTNDAIGSITRLIDMGVEPFLLSSALIGVMAQRLVRGVCPGCATSYLAPLSTLREMGVDASENMQLVRGRGCRECYDSGYKGRLAIHELLDVDAALQRLIVANPTREQLDAHLAESQHCTLREDGIARALEGKTTLEEVFSLVAG